MPDRHKSAPLSLRLPEAERQRLETYAREHDQPVRRVITQAVRLLLDQPDTAVCYVLSCGHLRQLNGPVTLPDVVTCGRCDAEREIVRPFGEGR